MRQASMLVLLALLLLDFGSCGGGGGLGLKLNPDTSTAQFQDPSDFVAYGLSAKELSGFSIRQLDEPGQGYNLGVYTHLDLQISRPAAGVLLFDLNLNDAPPLTTVYYELSWPSNEYILADACSGNYFQHDDVMAVTMTGPGKAEVGHVRLNFDSKGGVPGSGSLARFVFQAGDGSRQTSVAVDNQAQIDPNYDIDGTEDYRSIFGDDDNSIDGSRESNYDGVGQDASRLRLDGVMLQAISDAKLTDDSDLCFDPNTFMVNFITYLPGDCDFNGQVQIYDLTPMGRFHSGTFEKSLDYFNPTYPQDVDKNAGTADEPCRNFSDECRLFSSGSNHYFLRWIDGDFSTIINGQTGLINDKCPILGYSDNRPSHFGQQVKSYYMVVTTDVGLTGHTYSPTAGDRVLVFQRDGLAVMDAGVVPISEYDTGVYTNGADSGFFTYDFAPYYSSEEPQPRGWPTDYSAVINPDLIEVWSSSPEDSNGNWDLPATDYYVYFGTYDDSSGSASYGVLTGVGGVSPANLRFWTDRVPPKMLPAANGAQALDLKRLRKNVTFTGNAAASVDATHDDFYYEVLSNFDWKSNGFGGQAYYNGSESRYEIEVHYPQAWDISGVDAYEFYLTTAAVHSQGTVADSFFTDPDEETVKADVDCYTESAYNDGYFTFTSYDGAALSINTPYKVMVRPVDSLDYYPGKDTNEVWDEADMTADITAVVDTTAPDFAGLTSALPTRTLGEIKVTYPKAIEDASFPVTYRLGYALVSSYNNQAEFVADWANLPTNATASSGKLVTEILGTPGSSFSGTFTVTGLTGDVDYYFMMRVTDGIANEDDNEVVLIAAPISNAAPLWGEDGTAIMNVKENGSGSVQIFFADANDENGVSYRAIYGKRADFGTEEAFWEAYGDPNNTYIHYTNWVTETPTAPVRDTTYSDSGYDYVFTLNGLNNEDVYWFAIRAKDNHATKPKEEDNTKILPCRPSMYNWIEMDSTIDYNGFFPDIAAIQYQGMVTQTQLGISYLTSTREIDGVSFGGYYNCNDLRYITFDTGTSPSLIPQVVTNYSTSKVSLGETSITYLGDRYKPAIVYFANDSSMISDMHDDNNFNPAQVGPTGKTGSKAASEEGIWNAVQYSEFRDSAWWHDTVDRTRSIGDWTHWLGAQNGIVACQWEHPDGTTRWSPAVAYSNAIGVTGGWFKCRLLVHESNTPDVWDWRPYYWSATPGDNFKYSDNASTIDFMNSSGLGKMLGTDIILTNAAEETPMFHYGIAGRGISAAGWNMSWFGTVERSLASTISQPNGWAFRSDSSAELWDERNVNEGDWYLANIQQDSGSMISLSVQGYKLASYSVGSAQGYGALIVASEGIFYIDDTMTAYEQVEQFSIEQQNVFADAFDSAHNDFGPYRAEVGLAFNQNCEPGVVYPYWDDQEDTWVLRVAERSATTSEWTFHTILYDDPADKNSVQDEYLRQGRSVHAMKIAYMHTGLWSEDKWAVVYCDTNFRAFTDEQQSDPYQKLMLILEP